MITLLILAWAGVFGPPPGSPGTVSHESQSSASVGEAPTWGTADPGEFSEVAVYTPAAERLGAASPLVTEHHLVPWPLSSYDGTSFLVLAIGPAREDLALLESLKQDFYVLTPPGEE